MQPRFQTIAAQVAASLRAELQAGSGTPLPAERELARRLQVSRRTVRKALATLRGEGVVRTTRRRTHAVGTSGSKGPTRRSPQVNLLLPEPIEEARPFTALWINHLSGLLHERGCRVQIISGAKYYGARSGRSLATLVQSQPADCWVIARTNRALQQWFHERGLPAVISGSPYPGIALPSVDSDHTALSRHAAAQFLRHGHRRVALFFERIHHAGDVETETGFAAGMAAAPGSEPPVVFRVERTPEAVIRVLKHLLAQRSPPTGLLLCNSFSYLTILSYLASIGQRIPQDFSILSQDEGPFLSHIYPTPARYLTNPKRFATALHRAIWQVLEHSARPDFKSRIMPDFLPGGSIAAAKQSR